MDYNFAEFIARARKQCKTKDDFIAKTVKELDIVNDRPVEKQFKINRQAYINRLERAKFAAIANQFMEVDKYNEEIMNLLKNLA